MVLARDLRAALIFKAPQGSVANSHMHAGKLIGAPAHIFTQVWILSQGLFTLADSILDFVEKLR